MNVCDGERMANMLDKRGIVPPVKATAVG
ncbi:hypothetical protein K3174_08495 [Qipengyuania sp. 6D47A]|uniref:Uncharacterized protein n=1 Tax=Qipengyuania qiaonensis TaxID=2867240 RepID=A0ABS7J6L9_9SPHN|nr:hypothetical protein [Qipengyuania qiaonensis]